MTEPSKPESPDEILARVRREAHSKACICRYPDGEYCASPSHAAIDRLAEVAELKGRIAVYAEHDETCSASTECWLCRHADEEHDRLLAEIRRIGDAR